MFNYIYTIKGLNFERVFNNLTEQGIELSQITRFGNKICFIANYKQKLKLNNYFTQHNLDFECKPIGFMNFIYQFKNKWGIICALVVFVLGLIYSCTTINQCKVVGNSVVTKTQIQEVLMQNGYKVGMPKGDFDSIKAQNAILDSFEQIVFASVMVKGNSVVISVTEKKEQQMPNYNPLYAGFSGVVTKVNVKKGTSLVKVGDVVQKGQIVVEPYETLHGQRVQVEPEAEVFASVYVKGCVEYDSKGYLKGRTGESYQERSFYFFNLLVPCLASGDKDVLNGEYEVEEVEEHLFTLYNIKQIKKVYYKIGDTIKADYLRDKDVLEKQSKYLAYEQISGPYQLEEEKTQTIEVDGIYYITTYLQFQKNIIST